MRAVNMIYDTTDLSFDRHTVEVNISESNSGLVAHLCIKLYFNWHVYGRLKFKLHDKKFMPIKINQG